MWFAESNNFYQNYCLISDVYDQLELFYSITNKDQKSITNNETQNNFSFNSFNDIFKIDIVNMVYITKYKTYNNHYLINLENYKRKRNKNKNEFESFYNLDIDHKTQIKNFSGFTYNPNEPIAMQPIINENHNIPINNNPPSLDDFEIKKNKFYKRKIYSIKDKTGDKNNLNTDKNINYSNKTIEKPKCDLKYTFELDENDINLINEFVDPDPKYLQNSEYLQQDYFVNMEINSENYNKIFDTNNLDEKQLFEEYYNNTSKEFTDDILTRFNNNNNRKKNEKKRNELNDNDYLIYVVEESQFYKRLSATSEKNLSDTPKRKIKVKQLPLKIFDDHII